MASKTKRARQGQSKADKKVNFYLIAIPVLAFVIKLITMANTPHGGWLGADGENYLSGVDGLKEHPLLLASWLSDSYLVPYQNFSRKYSVDYLFLAINLLRICKLLLCKAIARYQVAPIYLLDWRDPGI